MARLSNEELVSICEHEIDSASGYTSGELAAERANAMDYYLGEPYGDEQEGRSQVVTREVVDTVESIMPQLMRIFADVENLVTFDPVGKEDEEAAEQESDRVNFAFWKENEGMFNLYSFCKDALLSKTGNLKCWWQDESAPEREEYKALDDIELGQLLSDPSVQREVMEYDLTPDGHHVVFETVKQGGKVCIEPVTPEEFGINRDARSPYISDAQFVYHRVRKSYADLLAEGYDKKTLDRIPTNDDVETEERLARRHLADESDVLRTHSHPRMRVYWITECYLNIDRDDDGIPELLKVTLATGAFTSGTGARLLDVEEVDEIPFFAASPIILTHKFYGLSIADMVLDLQRIKSTLLRQILDNAYLANNQRTAANDRVNLDDLLTNRPGGIVRVDGEQDIGGSLTPIPTTPLPAETFGLMQYLDEIRKDRTGSADEIPGLDAKSLANVNSGVAAIAYDQQRARIELIARILAEVALKPLFRRIHSLLQKNQKKEETVKLRGKWVPVNPSEWRERKNLTVNVGLGIASRERRLVALDAVAERQSQIVAGGGFGTLLLPQHLYSQLNDHAEALGLDGSKYYQNPMELPPRQPEGPSIQEQALLAQAQAQLMAAQAAGDKNKVEMARAQIAYQEAQLKAQATEREFELKRQTEVLKGELIELKSRRESEDKAAKAALDAEIKMKEQGIKVLEARMKDGQESMKREVDLYKAMLQSGTQLTAEQMKLMGGGVSGLQGDIERQTQEALAGTLEVIRAEFAQARAEDQAQIVELRNQLTEANAPKEIVRDTNGLIVSIGNRRIVRDDSGRAVSVG